PTPSPRTAQPSSCGCRRLSTGSPRVHRDCGHNRCMRVLVVEDQPKLAGLLARGLGEEGHAADVAERGEDALWMAQAASYDAIVLDVMLPGIDGFATCRKLRS